MNSVCHARRKACSAGADARSTDVEAGRLKARSAGADAHGADLPSPMVAARPNTRRHLPPKPATTAPGEEVYQLTPTLP
jgi:hypothetical protein